MLTKERFDEMVAQREQDLGKAPRQMKFHELNEIDEFINKALVQIRAACRGCLDYDAYRNQIICHGLKLTIIEKDGLNRAFYHLATERANPEWDWEWPEITDPDKKAEQALQTISEAHYKDTIGKIIYGSLRCTDILEGRAGNLTDLFAYIFDLGNIAASNERLALDREVVGRGEDLAPFEILDAIERAAQSGIKGKEASVKRSEGIKKMHQMAIETADQLWEEKIHKTKNHYQMAKFLINGYSQDGSTYPYKSITLNGLKKAIKDHLKQTGRSVMVYNG